MEINLVNDYYSRTRNKVCDGDEIGPKENPGEQYQMKRDPDPHCFQQSRSIIQSERQRPAFSDFTRGIRDNHVTAVQAAPGQKSPVGAVPESADQEYHKDIKDPSVF